MSEQHNAVHWFEIPVANLKRAIAFYEKVLGVTLLPQELDESRMAFFPRSADAPGAAGALVRAKSYKPSKTGVVLYFLVSSVNAALSKVEASGGTILLPRTSIGEWGFIAHFTDTEGNRLGFHSVK